MYKRLHKRLLGVAACMAVCGSIWLEAAHAFVTVDEGQWTESAVRRVLHVFAYGGAATDAQITAWSQMAPGDAIAEMLTFDAVNDRLSPVEDVTEAYAGSLKTLQTLWSSGSFDNLTCPSDRAAFNETRVRADGNTVLYNPGLQNTWIQAANKRGLNPFRHQVGFWLVNYQMAVNLHDTEAPLIRELYDSALDALSRGAPFHEVLAIGATSAAVAREYGHRNNRFNNNTGVFRGNDDFAREFHQLFFRINGDTEDADYHENVTIEHTAWALTGMQIDKYPNVYGATLARHWWVAPIDFSDHPDSTGRNIRNVSLHHRGDLEILHESIGGVTAEDKLFHLAAVAINHPESLDNLPVSIINFFADDNLSDDKVAAIRDTWRTLTLAEEPDDLLEFLRAYAVSDTFHRADTYKYRTAFSRNMTVYNRNTVDNEEAYGNAFSPRAVMNRQGAEVFIPVHDVFGGQTSLNAANNPNLFKEAYNSAVGFPNRIAKTADVCRDEAGANLGVWRKDWTHVIPADANGTYSAADVGRWLWDRFISDDGENYGTLEQAQVTALLATGRDLGYLVDPDQPDLVYSAQALADEPAASVVAANEAALLDLDNPVTATRREANRRVGMAINFIAMTPFMFATQGAVAVAPTPVAVTVPNVMGLARADAESEIALAGLSVGAVTEANSDTMPVGTVISQTPPGGEQADAGSGVDLVISLGATPQMVPDLVALAQADAEATILKAGLAVGMIGTQHSDTVPDGQVISQNPLAGSEVAPGSAVDLLVSLGPVPDQRPMVGIDSPADGAEVDEGSTIDFRGTASDAEDGDLTARLAWSSDLDGEIGGGAFFVTTLSPGTHRITAAATDSAGQSDSDAITLTVVRPPVEADDLQCRMAEYRVERDRLTIEVRTSDRSGERIMNAEIDIDGDGTYEVIGEIAKQRRISSTYRYVDRSLQYQPTAASLIRVTSDVGGVCTRTVKID